MRTLLLTRGIPASGKDYWIEQNNLIPYMLSADNIRLLMQSPTTSIDGDLQITQKNDKQVWKLLFELLEQRMERGEFVVVNATHYKMELLQRYYNLIKQYRYRAFVVDFTDVPLETCLERNRQREKYKFVPESVLHKMYTVFEAEKNSESCKEVSNKFTVIKPDEVQDILKKQYLRKDYTDLYEKIVVFGDIHGCYEPLNNYFKENIFRDDYLYIFTGDYLDRGIQNLEVLQFLQTIYKKKNVVLLEGNHEKHIREYSSKNCDLSSIKSDEFKNYTIPQIESFDRKELRQITRKFSQLEYFEFGIHKYVVCHGGVPCVPTLLTPTEELIKGVGKYEDEQTIGENFHKNTDSLHILIHGHRNIFDKPIKSSDYHYNLCDTPEEGKYLRIIEIDKNSNIKEILQPNTVFKENAKRTTNLEVVNMDTNNDILKQLNESKLIQKKILDNGIVSYNFTRKCFYDKIWNDLTCRARGLFVDSGTDKVIARGYTKFFNIGECKQSELPELYKTLKFPVTAYLKENGFIAFVSYNPKTDDLFIASKSTNKGDYVDMIKEELYKPEIDISFIKQFCKDNDVTLIFECINKDKDPHIIEYDKNKLVLLDVVNNQLEDNFMPYFSLQILAKNIGVQCKVKLHELNTWEEFKNWYDCVSKNDLLSIEGYVIQDSNNFRVKYKTNYYNFWKYMRSIKDKMSKGQNIRPSFKNKAEIDVYNYMRQLSLEQLKEKSIIDIRNDIASLLERGIL